MKKKCEGMRPPEMRRLRQLGEENTKLRKLVADLSLDCGMLQDVEVAYKADDIYAPQCESGLAWNDPALGGLAGFARPFTGSARGRS